MNAKNDPWDRWIGASAHGESSHRPAKGPQEARSAAINPKNDAQEPTGVPRADLRLVATAIDQYLDGHLATCELGPRVCIDCACAQSGQNRSRLTEASMIARHAKAALEGLGKVCVYCGDYANTRDHLLPKGWTGLAARQFVPVLPACSDCNSRINDFPSPRIEERAARAAESLRKRYAKQLLIPDRTDAEIASFGVHMRTALLVKRDEARSIRRRLSVLDLGGMPFVPEPMRSEIAA